MFVNKRNVRKQGVMIGHQMPAIWVSKYMSLTLTETGLEFPWEGFNEAGLSVHILELASSRVPSPFDPRPALQMEQWIQYILDTSGNLNEAIANAQRIRVGVQSVVHYFICDASSLCGVFEFIDGDLIVHSGAALPYPALTNNTYAESLTYLIQQLNGSPPTEIMMKQSSRSLDRFSRAALWSSSYSSDRSQLEYTFSALNNLQQMGAGLQTFWKMAFHLRSLSLSWKTLNAPGLKSFHLADFNPDCSSGVQWLDVNSPLTGSVTSEFQNDPKSTNRSFIEGSHRLSAEEKDVIGHYPETQTKCLD